MSHPIRPFLFIGLLLAAGLGCLAADDLLHPSLLATPQENLRGAEDVAQRYLSVSGRRELGVHPGEGLRERSVIDDGAGVAHVRFDTEVRGVRVFGSEIIVHVDLEQGIVRSVTNQYRPADVWDEQPAISRREAMDIALWNMAWPLPLSREPRMELVYYPRDNTHYLAWAVDCFLEAEELEPQARLFIIDALTGEILDSWDNLQTGHVIGSGAAAVGTGKTLYLGSVALNTERYSDGVYGMVDHTNGNNVTRDLRHKYTGAGYVFEDSDNTWGNSSISDHASAGADAHLGMTYTYNYFRTIHGRNGIYGDGRGVYSRVHYGASYANAFWADDCQCMTYGDGNNSTFSTLVCIDVAAHEMSHGITSATARLIYSGESGGLNEATSDIFGTCVEFFANNPKDVPDWWIGEVIYSPYRAGDALRYMDTPKRDGKSIDHYSLFRSSMDVHYSSGIANNFFYLLAAGGQNATSKLRVTGIGLAKAERIWYVGLTGYMTASTNFHQARIATLSAAAQLYGNGGVEYNTVASAWTAVGVN